MFSLFYQIIGSRGNNLHEAETSSGNNFLISMPSKFRKNVWIKRGIDSFKHSTFKVFFQCNFMWMVTFPSVTIVYTVTHIA